MSRPLKPWIIRGILTLLAFIAGFRQDPGRTSGSPAADQPALTKSPRLESHPLTLASSQWRKAWDSAGPAQRALLVESWQDRDPAALYAFLRKLPPLTLPGQRELEDQALFAWGKRDPLAAYPIACAHHWEYGAADQLLQYWIEKDLDQALQLATLRSGGRNGMAWSESAAESANAERICATLARAGSSLSRDIFLQNGASYWAKKDPAAAIAYAKSLPAAAASVMMRGIIKGLSLEDAARLTADPANSGMAVSMAWDLMSRWGRQDAPAALTWSAERLPPAAFRSAFNSFLENAAAMGSYSEETLPRTGTAIPPAGWRMLANRAMDYSPDKLTNLIPYAPEWALPGMADQLKFSAAQLANPKTIPRWFAKLSPESAAVVVESSFGKNGLNFQTEDPAILSKLPPQWQPAAAAGLEKARPQP